MPSGHVQTAAFCAVWVSRLTRSYVSKEELGYVNAGLIWLVALTARKRMVIGRHTLAQVLAGGAIGTALGWITFDWFQQMKWVSQK